MAKGKKSFILYTDLIHTVEKLPDEIAGKFLKHMLRYVNDLNPVADDLLIEAVFEPLRQQLKRDLQKWEEKSVKRSEIGRLGGLKSAEAKATKSNQKQPIGSSVKQNQHVNDNVNVNDNVLTKVNNKKSLHSFSESPFFDKAKFAESLEGWEREKLIYYYQSAVDYSESKNAKYANWISAVRNWERKDKAESKGYHSTQRGKAQLTPENKAKTFMDRL